MFDVAFAPLREDANTWVRFRPTACLIRGAPEWRLSLESDDGLWSGSALVANCIGIGILLNVWMRRFMF